MFSNLKTNVPLKNICLNRIRVIKLNERASNVYIKLFLRSSTKNDFTDRIRFGDLLDKRQIGAILKTFHLLLHGKSVVCSNHLYSTGVLKKI